MGEDGRQWSGKKFDVRTEKKNCPGETPTSHQRVTQASPRRLIMFLCKNPLCPRLGTDWQSAKRLHIHVAKTAGCSQFEEMSFGANGGGSSESHIQAQTSQYPEAEPETNTPP